MPLQKTDRDAVIQAAVHCFKTKGFYQTSMADLGEESGLLKGSLYHYFKNKDELAVATVSWVHDWFRENVFAVFNDSSRPWEERWTAGWDATARYFEEREGGCLPGNLTLEIGLSHPELTKACQDYFLDWERAIAHSLSNLSNQTNVREKARTMIAELQGLLLLERLQGKGLLQKRIEEIKGYR